MINWQPTCSLYEQYEQRPLVKTRYQGWGLGIDIELDVHTIHPEQSPHDITYIHVLERNYRCWSIHMIIKMLENVLAHILRFGYIYIIYIYCFILKDMETDICRMRWLIPWKTLRWLTRSTHYISSISNIVTIYIQSLFISSAFVTQPILY